jgi:hypothetical protein
LKQCLLVSGHHPTEAHRADEDVRFEWALTADKLMALLDKAYARRDRQWPSRKVS